LIPMYTNGDPKLYGSLLKYIAYNNGTDTYYAHIKGLSDAVHAPDHTEGTFSGLNMQYASGKTGVVHRRYNRLAYNGTYTSTTTGSLGGYFHTSKLLSPTYLENNSDIASVSFKITASTNTTMRIYWGTTTVYPLIATISIPAGTTKWYYIFSQYKGDLRWGYWNFTAGSGSLVIALSGPSSANEDYDS